MPRVLSRRFKEKLIEMIMSGCFAYTAFGGLEKQAAKGEQAVISDSRIKFADRLAGYSSTGNLPFLFTNSSCSRLRDMASLQ